MDEAIIAQHGLAHRRGCDDRALADQAVVDLGRGEAFARPHEPRRRVIALGAPDPPLAVVEVERRDPRAQLHVRGEVGVDRPDIAPVWLGTLRLTRDAILCEVVDEHVRAASEELRDDVAAEIVPRAVAITVVAEYVLEHLALEDVVAHRHERPAGAPRNLRWIGGLFDEADDPAGLIDIDDAKRARLRRGHGERSDREIRIECTMLILHLIDRHLVDVVTAEHGDVRGAGISDEVEVLIDGVGGASVPELAEPHLRGDDLDVLAEAGQPPVARHVLDQTRGHVLRQHVNPAVARIDEVRQHEVDDPVAPRERHSWLRPVDRERSEARALAAGHDHHEGVLHA